MWALGIILYELITGKDYDRIYKSMLHKANENKTKENSIYLYMGLAPFKIEPDLKKLMYNLFLVDPTERITAKDALKLINTTKMGTIEGLNAFYQKCIEK